MGYENRELEVKLQLHCTSFDTAERTLDTVLSGLWNTKLSGKSKDIYYKTYNNEKVDFLRIRFLPENNSGEITVKYSDKGTNTDRVEIDLAVSDPQQATVLFTQLMGEPAGSITKQYSVYFLPNGATISLYRVLGDSRLFVEVEAREQLELDRLVSNLIEDCLYDMTKINKSLFDLFIKGQ